MKRLQSESVPVGALSRDRVGGEMGGTEGCGERGGTEGV